MHDNGKRVARIATSVSGRVLESHTVGENDWMLRNTDRHTKTDNKEKEAVLRFLKREEITVKDKAIRLIQKVDTDIKEVAELERRVSYIQSLTERIENDEHWR